MKEIWNQFVEKCVAAWETCYAGIKQVCKSTFELLKTTCIDFVKGVFSWLWEVLSGLGKVVWAMVLAVVAALIAMVKAILDLGFNKVIAWIKKW